jgi:glycosyltransferase involved in cell wall biosynthesis
MKILQVLPDMQAGGVEVEAAIVARGIRDRGHGSYVVAHSDRMIHGEPGIQFIPLDLRSKNPLRILANGFRLAEIAAQLGIDLFHVRSRAPAWSVLLASRISRIPFISTWHSTFGIDSLGFKKLYNGVMAKGRYVISISGFITDYIRGNYAVDAAKIVQIDRGVDLRQFSLGHQPATTRAALGLPENVRLIGSLGRISSSWKGFDILVAALPHLPADMHLAIAGADPKGKKSELVALASSLGVGERLHFVAHLPSVLDFIALCDMGASGVVKGEAFGRTAVEFQAMGKPFFGSNLGAFRENVSYGALFEAGNPQDFAAKVQAFLAEEAADAPEQRLARRQAAHKFVHAKYNQETMVDRTVALYEKVLREDKSADRAQEGG